MKYLIDEIEEEEISSGISDTETVESDFISSAKTSVETNSDVESIFDDDFDYDTVTENWWVVIKNTELEF